MKRETASWSAPLIVFCTALLGSSAALAADLPSASPESVGMSNERLGRLDAVTHGWVDTGRIAGVVTLVARRGKKAMKQEPAVAGTDRPAAAAT